MSMLVVRLLSALVCTICSRETFNRHEVMQSVWSVSALTGLHLWGWLAWSMPSDEESSDISIVRRPVDLQQNNGHVCEGGTGRDGGGTESYSFSCNIEGTEAKSTQHRQYRTLRRALQSTYQFTTECQQLVNDRDSETRSGVVKSIVGRYQNSRGLCGVCIFHFDRPAACLLVLESTCLRHNSQTGKIYFY